MKSIQHREIGSTQTRNLMKSGQHKTKSHEIMSIRDFRFIIQYVNAYVNLDLWQQQPQRRQAADPGCPGTRSIFRRLQQIQAAQALDPYSDGCSNSSSHLVLSSQAVHVRLLWLGMLTSLDIRRNGYLIDKKRKVLYIGIKYVLVDYKY